MDVTLTIKDVDFSPWLSSYTVKHEIAYGQIVTTFDGMEHTQGGTRRPIVTFSMFPVSDAVAGDFYAVLSDLIVPVTFTDPNLGGRECTLDMRVVSDLETAFGIRSVDGNRYYKETAIQLRAVTVYD